MPPKNKFVVYITMYKGNKLPKWYIGSTNLEQIHSGYLGSVKSIRYKNIWEYELKHNKHLFKNRILSFHKTREGALEEEFRVQKMHDVVKNDKYINMSLANKNGFFGKTMTKEEKLHMVSKRLKTGNGDYHGGKNPFADKEIQKQIRETMEKSGKWTVIKSSKYLCKNIEELSELINVPKRHIRLFMKRNKLKIIEDDVIENIIMLMDLEPKDKSWMYRNEISKNGLFYSLYYKLDIPFGFELNKLHPRATNKGGK